MLKTTTHSEDFHLDLLVRINGRNCRQLASRLLAAFAAIAIAAAKVAAAWLTISAG